MTRSKNLTGLLTQRIETHTDLMCCAFGLRECEITIYSSLIDNPMTVEDISSIICRDRSTTQRALKTLLRKGLIERDRKHMERGGYFYIYKSISSEEVHKQILAQLDQWYQDTRRFLLESWPQSVE
ncbi:MAG: helix-turn-helix domain-containing protein [Candidatus Thorarchaeota archaeon]